MSAPDMDFMLVLDHISFSEESQRCGNLILKEDTPFLDAYITNKATANLWQEFLLDQDVAQSNRLSSKKLKEKLHEKHQLMDVFGYAWKDNATANVDGAAMYTIGLENLFSPINGLLSSVQSTVSKDNASKLHAHVNFVKDIYSENFTGCDIVLAISCDGWPSCAREWITRD